MAEPTRRIELLRLQQGKQYLVARLIEWNPNSVIVDLRRFEVDKAEEIQPTSRGLGISVKNLAELIQCLGSDIEKLADGTLTPAAIEARHIEVKGVPKKKGLVKVK